MADKATLARELYDAWNAEQAEPTARDNPNKKAKKKGNAKGGKAGTRKKAAAAKNAK